MYERDKSLNFLEEKAHNEAMNLILLEISDSSILWSSKVIVFLFNQMCHATAIQHLRSSLAFFLFPLKHHSIHKKSYQDFGQTPTTSNSPELLPICIDKLAT